MDGPWGYCGNNENFITVPKHVSMANQDYTSDQTGFLSVFNELFKQTEVAPTNLNDSVNVIPAQSIKKKASVNANLNDSVNVIPAERIKKKASMNVTQQVCNPYKAKEKNIVAEKHDNSKPKSTLKKLVGKGKASTPKKLVGKGKATPKKSKQGRNLNHK